MCSHCDDERIPSDSNKFGRAMNVLTVDGRSSLVDGGVIDIWSSIVRRMVKSHIELDQRLYFNTEHVVSLNSALERPANGIRNWLSLSVEASELISFYRI
jgi:hypothetical protein